MFSTLSVDDFSCIIFVLCILTHWMIRHHYRLWYYTSLARFFRGVESLARTRAFIIAICDLLIAKDAYDAIVRVVELMIPGKLKSFFSSGGVSYVRPTTAEYAAAQYPAPINKTLLTWIEEDAEEAWKLKRKMREEEASRRWELMVSDEGLAPEQSDDEVVF